MRLAKEAVEDGEAGVSSDEDSGSVTASEEEWDVDSWDDEDGIEDDLMAKSAFVEDEFFEDEVYASASSQSEDSLEGDEWEDFYVMHVSSAIPSKIDGWVERNAMWTMAKAGELCYLMPVEEIIEIDEGSADDGDRIVTINDIKYDLTINENNHFKLYPVEAPLNRPLAVSPREIEKKYSLVQENDRLVLAPKARAFSLKRFTISSKQMA